MDRSTHDNIKQLAAELGSTVGEAVALAVRRLRQERIGRQLASDLTAAETAWLDADFR